VDSSSPESDQWLMRCVQEGQPGCFAALVERYQEALLRVASSRLARRDWAEDVVQETFLAAFKSRHTYDDRYGFRTWLWTILLRQCERFAARMARVPRVSPWSDQAPESEAANTQAAPTATTSPLALLLADERDRRVELLLRRLPSTQANALRLRFFGGLKFHEMAVAMGCSLGTAKNRVRAGLLQMAEWLDESNPHSSSCDGRTSA